MKKEHTPSKGTKEPITGKPEPQFLDACCYHAAPGFLQHLAAEIGTPYRTDGELVTVMGPARSPYWRSEERRVG